MQAGSVQLSGIRNVLHSVLGSVQSSAFGSLVSGLLNAA